MKKILLSFALTVGLLTSASTAMAQTTYNLRIAGVQVTSANCSDLSVISGVSGTVKYDPTNKVLTLDGATINSSTISAINSDIDGLTVKVIGTNNLTATMAFHNTATITGGGTLNVEIQHHSAIYVNGTNLTIDGCTVNAKGGYGIAGKNGSSETLTIKNSTVTAEGASQGSIVDFAGLTLDGCAITQPAGAAFDASLHAVALGGAKVTSKVVISPTESNMSRYITLTVKSGEAIKIDLKAAAAGTPVRIVSGSNTQDITVGTSWTGFANYTADDTEMKVYGDLIGFDCQGNGANLTALDVSHNTLLKELLCQGNRLSNLDVSKNTQLEWLYCYGNKFTTAALDDIYCTLPDRTGKYSSGMIYTLCNTSSVAEQNMVKATNATNATAKDWRVLTNRGFVISTDITTTGTYVCGTPHLDTYITLTVKSGKAIRLDFEAAADGTPVRIVSGSNTQDITVGTGWKGATYYTTNGTKMKIYGNIIGFDCNYNEDNITALDVSHSPKLGTLLCQSNQLSSLDVSKNTELNWLVCYDNNFSTQAIDDIFCALPDRTGNTNGVILPVYDSSSPDHATVLATNAQNAIAKNWKVQYHNDTDIPATTGTYTCPELNMSRYITLTVKSGKVISLNFRAAAEYTPVRVVSGSNTEALTVGTSWYGGSSPSNYFLTSDGTTITIYGDITDFDCRDNEEDITAIDISSNTLLEWLICPNNHISKLDLSKNTELSLLNCKDNKLSSLDISKNTKLTTLYCPGNNLSTQALDDIYCTLPVRHASDSALIEPVYNSSSPDIATVLATNKQNAIDKNWKVQYYADDTDIPATTGTYTCPQLNMSRYITLTVVAKDSAIKLDFMAAAAGTPIRIVSGSNTRDTTVGASWTGIKYYAADGTTMTVYGDLKNFNCSGNGENITALDVLHSPELEMLISQGNRISSLDVSKNTLLTTLDCSYNNLSSLDISKNTQLDKLYCSGNKLSSLDISKNTKLTHINCSSNNLISLNVSKNTELRRLICYGNNFTTAAIDDIYCSLPDRTGSSYGEVKPIADSSSPDLATVLASNKANATAKNWKVQYAANNSNIPATTGKHKCPTTTDISEASAEPALTLYPNPVADVLYLSATARTIRIYDIYGIEVAHATDTDRVEVSHLPAGIYTVKADGTVAKMVKR